MENLRVLSSDRGFDCAGQQRFHGSDNPRAIAGKLHIMELKPDGGVHQKITLPGVFNPITYVHDFVVTKSWCGCASCRRSCMHSQFCPSTVLPSEVPRNVGHLNALAGTSSTDHR